MTELASVLSVLVGVLAIGVALATVTLTALYRMERRIDQRFSQFETYTNQRFDQIDQRFDQVDQRFDQVDRRIDHLAERVAKLEAGQARLEGQLDIIRATLFDQAPVQVQE
jgi:hypothetical protein